MKKYVTMVFMVAAAACMLMFAATFAAAGDEAGGFSVGHGSLAPTATDAKGQAPSAVTARYGFKPAKKLSTFIGTGLAYSLTSPVTAPDVAPKELKTGVAGQAGFSFQMGERSFLNFDYKYLYFGADKKTGADPQTPQLLGIGLDIKF